MSTGHRALRLALTFLLGSATSKILVLALLPLYTRVLSPAEYGFFDLSVTYVTIAGSILFLDVWVGTMRYMYRAADTGDKGTAVKSGLLILTMSVALFAAVGLGVGTLLAVPFLGFILAYGITMNVREFYGFVARGYDLNATYSVSGAANTVVMVGLNLVMLLLLDTGLSALYVAAIAGNVLQILWIELRARVLSTLWRYPTDWATLREMLRFALPLGVNSVAYWLLTGIGKIVVSDQMSLGENGYYGIGTRIATLVVVLASVFTMVWQDISFTRGSRDPSEFYGRASSFYLAFVGFGSAGLVVVLGLAFPVLVGPSFAPLFDLLPGFIFVAALAAYSTFLGNTFYALNTTAIVLATTLAGSVLTVIASYPAVAAWGIAGANLAASAGFVLIIVARLVMLRRRIGLSYPISSALSSALVGGLASLTYLYDVPWVSMAMLVLLAAIFVLLYRRDLKRLFRRPSAATS